MDKQTPHTNNEEGTPARRTAGQSSKIVVTGASGYLGRHLVMLLAEKGYRIAALMRDPAGFRAGRGVEPVPYDLEDPIGPCAEIFTDAAAVIHAAANMNGEPSLSERMEVNAARKLVRQAGRAGVRRLVFISSIVVQPDAPRRYPRVKWAIEQVFLRAGGTVIRPGLIYGGCTDSNHELFAALDRFARTSPCIPAFFPPLWVQPVHVDDVCNAILHIIEETGDPQPICQAAPESVRLTAFLRRLAWHRHRRYPVAIPFPVLLASLAAAVGRIMPLVPAWYVERLTGLRALRRRPPGETRECRGVALRPLAVGVSAPLRRELLEEGRALGRYLNGQFPGYSTLSRYVRALEQGVPEAQRHHSLELAPFFLRWPAAVRLIDPRSPLCRLAPDRQDELDRRLEVMAALSESDPLTAPKYHSRKPVFLLFVVLTLSLGLLVEMFLWGLAVVVRLGHRLSKKPAGKLPDHAL